MLTPEFLESCTKPMSRLVNSTVDWILERIARDVARTGRLSISNEYQLIRLNAIKSFNEDYKAKIAELSGKSISEIDRLFTEASQQAYSYDRKLFDASSTPFIPWKQNSFVRQLTAATAAQTKGVMKNLTQTTALKMVGMGGRTVSIPEYFTQTLDNVTMQVSTGATSYDEAIKRAIKGMKKNGIKTIVYDRTGKLRRMSIEAVARMTVLTGVGQIANQITEHNAELLDTTVYEISFHFGNRPSHGWGGMRYDTTGKDYPTPERLFAENGGGILGEWNCRHSAFATFTWLSPNYTAKQLKEMNTKDKETKPYTINGEEKQFTLYEATQRQRKLERQMRKQRQEAALYKSAGLDDDYKAAKSKYYAQRKAYKTFSVAMGIDTQYERVYMDNLGKV